jgi:hypothetical protein
MSSVGAKRSSTKREDRDETFRECPSGTILTPRITSELRGADATVVLSPDAAARVDVEGFGSGGRLGGGESDPSRIWHFGLCDFDAANSHFEDYHVWRMR